MAINGVTTALNRPYMSFALRKICIDGQTMYTFSRSHENLLSPTNEVQFIDCLQTVYEFCDLCNPYGLTNCIYPILTWKYS